MVRRRFPARGVRPFVAAAMSAMALALPVPAIALDHDAYRADLVALMQVVAEIRERVGPTAPGAGIEAERAVLVYSSLTDRQIDAVDASLPAHRLHELVTRTRRLMQAAATPAKLAVTLEPDVSPEFCNDYPAPVVLAALATKHVADHVIKALEFTCQQTSAGINAALGCEAPEIAATTADIASTLADFCGGQQSAATNQAVLANERSIGRHLDQQLDVELSTRATQTSLDMAQDALASGADTLSDIRTRLDQDAVSIAARIEDALQDLAALAASITDLQSRSQDLVLRMRVNQGFVEDVESSGAELEEIATELVVASEAHRNEAAALVPRAEALAPAIADAARSERRDALAAALGASNLRVATFALPVAMGGNLEEAREVLIEALVALQALGQGDTAQAMSRLAAGDAAYNQGRYGDAWREFSAAYRGLDPHASGGAPP